MPSSVRVSALLMSFAVVLTGCTSGDVSGQASPPAAQTVPPAAAPSTPPSGPQPSPPTDDAAPASPSASVEAPFPVITDEQGVADLIVSDKTVDKAFPRYRMEVTDLRSLAGPADWVKAVVVRPRACRPLIDGPGAEVKRRDDGRIAWWAESAWESRETDPEKLNLFPKVLLYQGVAVYDSEAAAQEKFALMAEQANKSCRKLAYKTKGVGTIDNDFSVIEYDAKAQSITMLDLGSVLVVTRLSGDKLIYGGIIGSSAKPSQIPRMTGLVDQSAQLAGG